MSPLAFIPVMAHREAGTTGFRRQDDVALTSNWFNPGLSIGYSR